MPSQRRMRFFGTLIVITIVVLFYMSRAAQQTQTSDFYTKTQQALQEKEFAEAAKQRDADSVGSRLKAAEEQAKKNAGQKYTEVKESVEGPDSKGVAGRVKMDSEKVPGVAQQGGRPRDQAAMKEHETPEDHEVEIEMNAILKKSPSTSRPRNPPSLTHLLTCCSDHLLKVLLPLLEEGEAHPPRKVPNRTRTLRRRARSKPHGRTTASLPA
jgi:hypothetical protein